MATLEQRLNVGDATIVIRAMLDCIGSLPGSLIYRGPDRWQALEPGNPGDVLTVDANGYPQWVDPATLGL